MPAGLAAPVPVVPIGGGTALGGVALGGVAVGGVDVGGIDVGGVAVGGLVAGGVPAGGVDVGGVPAGGVSVGGVGLGIAAGGVPAGGVDGVMPVAPGCAAAPVGWIVPWISTRELARARKSPGLPPLNAYDVVAPAALEPAATPFGAAPVRMNPPGCPG